MYDLNLKIVHGLERISDVFKTLLWEKAKVHGISPIQIQIILFISTHNQEHCNVSHLAKEFNLTKATISDAVRVLLVKGLLEKDYTPTDRRRFNLRLTHQGHKMLSNLSEYFAPVSEEVQKLSEFQQESLFQSITKLIYQLNQKGIIQVQRTCFNCRFYSGNRDDQHFCNFLDQNLVNREMQLDCGDFEEIAPK